MITQAGVMGIALQNCIFFIVSFKCLVCILHYRILDCEIKLYLAYDLRVSTLPTSRYMKLNHSSFNGIAVQFTHKRPTPCQILAFPRHSSTFIILSSVRGVIRTFSQSN